MTRRIALAAVGVTGLVACSDAEIDPSTRITGPRVLAVTTEPSTLPLDGELALVAFTVDGDGPRSTQRPVAAMRVRACAPWILLADPARDCVGDAALPLDVDPAGRVVTSAAQLAAAFPPPSSTTGSSDAWRAAIAAGVTLQVPFIVEVEVDGRLLVARRDVSVVDGTAAPHQNPRMIELRFDGEANRTLRAGERYQLTATIDRASLDVAADAPPDQLETVTVHFYSPNGDLAEPEASLLDPAAPVPETAENVYTAGAPGTTWLYAVATDQTGGMSATAVPVVVE